MDGHNTHQRILFEITVARMPAGEGFLRNQATVHHHPRPSWDGLRRHVPFLPAFDCVSLTPLTDERPRAILPRVDPRNGLGHSLLLGGAYGTPRRPPPRQGPLLGGVLPRDDP